MQNQNPAESFHAASYTQLISLRHELESLFSGVIACHAEGDPSHGSNTLFVRLYRDNSPIRDTTFVLNIFPEHVLLRFSTIETVGSLVDAKAKLVNQIHQCVLKANLTFAYDEAAAYALSESERDLVKALIPESYRKKIEGLGIDWREAQ
jgi:hypothetical protein